MATPDATFHNLKRLHVVFAMAALALLAATVWMVVEDHCRQWKQFQRTFRDEVEPWLTEARIEQERSAEFAAREQELSDALANTEVATPAQGLTERFMEMLREDAARRKAPAPDCSALAAAHVALAAEPSPAARGAFLTRLRTFCDAARLRQENLERQLRFRRADFDQARTAFEAAVGEGRAQPILDQLQEQTTAVKLDVDRLAAEVEGASAHTASLVQIVGQMAQAEDAARARLAEHRAAASRLELTLSQQRPNVAKQLLRLPGIDVFGRPLAVEQIWLPELTIDYNFRQVARFDRCTSCHLGIDKTAPGSSSEPAYRGETRTSVELATPAKPPQTPAGQASAPESDLDKLYGLVLAPRGILNPDAPTIQLVRPRTAAAQADLQVGDVIERIGDAAVASRAEAIELLTSPPKWGQPVRLAIRRGLPHPYSSHPRLDLFVGSRSPHPAATFGCTVCHEGQGSGTQFAFASHTPNAPADGARWAKDHRWFRNADWDFPMRPKRFVESSCLKCHHEVTDLAPNARFRQPPAPRVLSGYQLVRQYGCFGCHEIKGVGDAQSRTGPDMRLEPGGTMRKVAPSLRNVAGKLDAPFVESWLRRPSDFRPNTRMPQFFGLHEHLDGPPLEDTRRMESVEIRALAEFLLTSSQAVPPLPVPARVTETPSADRGKRLFQLHGCLACHKHADFPQGQATVGPDLSRLGAKLSTAPGRKWLVDWLRDPLRHGAQTVMPNPLLEPVPLAGQENSDKPKPGAKPRMSDPAADLAAYLLASTDRQVQPSPPLGPADVDALALLHLSKVFPKKLAEQYLREGIPESMAGQVRGDTVELVGKMTLVKKVRYVGRQTIRKRGCYGCHDIAGSQDAAPIGPALSDWGRKQTSLLAFERVNQFVVGSRQKAVGSRQNGVGSAQDGESEAAGLAPRAASQAARDADTTAAFFREALLAHRREGFIWQKLHAPRSFDYRKAENKTFNEQLLMGRFSLGDDQIEAIITFVLGLVSQPPAEKYVHRPAARGRAIVEGRKVLDKYACAQCHTLEMERWRFQYDPAKFAGPKASPDYAFLKPLVSAEQMAASRAVDRCGRGVAEVVGMARVDAKGRLVEEEDDDGNPVYFFDLWEPAAINGAVWPVGGAQVPIAKSQLLGTTPALGGELARLLYPLALADAKASGSTAAEAEAWGWVPPSLAHEGQAVQPAWLHDYLLSPTAIRPASVLRMPKYNLSPDEAGKLVNYFAAVAGVDFPYATAAQGSSGRTASTNAARLDSALRILVDRKTFCGKCHLIGDYNPGGQIQTTLAPNLEIAGRRIRPEYMRRWLANPKSVLPYTAMPVNFPPTGEPLGQDLYRAGSVEQLDALVDLLLNYDQYMGRRTSVQKLGEAAEKEKTATIEKK